MGLYADAIGKMLAQIGQPSIAKQTTTTTGPDPILQQLYANQQMNQGIDIGQLLMMLMLGGVFNKKTPTTGQDDIMSNVYNPYLALQSYPQSPTALTGQTPFASAGGGAGAGGIGSLLKMIMGG